MSGKHGGRGTARGGMAYRAAVAGRVVLAVLGGYGVASLCTALLSLTLPLVRSEAVTVAMLASFAIMVAAVVYVFAARSLGRAVVGLGGLGLLLGCGLWLIHGFA